MFFELSCLSFFSLKSNVAVLSYYSSQCIWLKTNTEINAFNLIQLLMCYKTFLEHFQQELFIFCFSKQENKDTERLITIKNTGLNNCLQAKFSLISCFL